MTERKLPTKLKKEPLIEAVFDVRFDESAQLAELLPGLLHAKLREIRIEKLPVANFPKELRDADPQLKYAAVVRVFWGKYVFLISDHSVAVACLLPYPGWAAFRDTIQLLVNTLIEYNVPQQVTRCSIKYVDVIEGKTEEVVSGLNVRISVGGHEVRTGPFNLMFESTEGAVIHAVSIGGPGVAQLVDGSKREGVIISIDSIESRVALSLNDFNSELASRLNSLHSRNKAKFFDCLSEDLEQRLEPSYE